MPQVLLEAFAARLPVVATAVGSVPLVVEGRGLLIPPSDADVAAQALQRLVSDTELRTQLVDAAAAEVRDHTLASSSARLARFLAANAGL
jgi:glycosyltransferase involved in cell wall biosynthesis